MKLDYKNQFKPKPAEKTNLLKYWHLHGILLTFALFIAAILLTESEDSRASITVSAEITPKTAAKTDSEIKTTVAKAAIIPKSRDQIAVKTHDLILPPNKLQHKTPLKTGPAEDKQELEQTLWQIHKVKPGYNLSIIAEKAGVGASEIHALMKHKKSVSALKTLYPGDELRFKVSPQGKLLALEYDIHESKKLYIEKTDTDANGVSIFDVKTIDRPLEIRTAHASGIIPDGGNLNNAAGRAGLSETVKQELADIFEWDIDYDKDVRPNDLFAVVYEEHYRNGEKVGDGVIIAAEFVNNGRKLRAVRYTDPKGRTDYYSPDGRSVRKTFMRNPINYFRISSRFNPKRRHPILNKIRAHNGVDYAAARGTAIRATGDGKIVHRGRKGGYGKTIIIKHGQRYSTLYAHMSSYGKGTGVGRHVKQGQIIGKVGSTGLATGPHLHYEFRVNGKHRNPLTVKHPSVKPIAKAFKNDFFAKSQPLFARLDTINEINLALNQ